MVNKKNRAFNFQAHDEVQTTVWLTPPSLVQALGEFDLDPCQDINQPWTLAKNHYSLPDDGLSLPWKGRVWLNPPYGPSTPHWMRKLKEHGTGTALVFARVETKWFQDVWKTAAAVFFFSKRLLFHFPDGTLSSGRMAASALIAYGKADADALENCGFEGAYIRNFKWLNGSKVN